MNWLKKIRLNLRIKLIKRLIKIENELYDMYIERSAYLNDKSINTEDNLKHIKYSLESRLSLARARYMQTQAKHYAEHLTELEELRNANKR